MSILDTHAWFTGSVHSYGSISASQGFSGSFSGDGSGLTGVVVQGVISSSAQVDHNETRNYTASRHIDHASVYITGSGGLTGGGVITTSQAIELDTNSSTFTGGVKSYAYYSSSISSSLITLYKDAGGNHTLDLSGVTGGVSSYTDLTNIPENIISSSIQIAALGFITSSSLGLSTKVGSIPSSSFQNTGSDSYADVVFATPFSSSNYSVAVLLNSNEYNVGAYPESFHIHNKTTTGFRVVNGYSVDVFWGAYPGATLDYIAIAQGETAVTSSFTELASTASYVDFTNIGNLPTLISGSSQISALGFLTSSSLGLNTKVGNIPSSSFLASGSLTVAQVTFATPFSSSNYAVSAQYNDSIALGANSPLDIKSKTAAGFEIVSPNNVFAWNDRPGSSVDYIAVAYGETAVTSSFTELASTASYAITASYALNAGGVTSYTELSNIPENIISSSIQIAALGFLTSSSLGLNTKVGSVSTSSFVPYKATDLSQSTRSSASIEFATPFSSSNYEVFLQISTFTDVTGSNVGIFAPGCGVVNKTPSGFSIVSGIEVGTWGIYDSSTISYVAIADGETAVTSSFTELSSTASYVEYSNVANKPTLLSGSQQIAGDISGSLGVNATLIRSLTASSISGSFTSLSGSIAANIAANASSIGSLNAASSSYLLNTTDTLTGNLTVTGTITAQEFHTEFVSASIIFQSGSTKFGNSVDDTHQFTGSVLVKGDLLPGLNEQYDLGSASNRWKDLYLSGSTIYLGDAQISEASWNAVSSSASSTYTLPAATSTVRGGIELFNDTVQSVAANAVSTTAGRTYGVQVNSDGQAVVNIPWTDTDTNTTYSISAETVTGGANLRLTDSGAGTDDVAIKGSGATTVTRTDANTITISSTDTNTNTTYSISAETTTGGANLRLTDSGAGTDDVKLAGGTNVTVTRTDANTITISSTDTVNTYTAGNGLELTGNAFSLNTGSAHFISGSRELFSAGANVSITNGVISSTDTKVTVNNNTNNYVLTGTGTTDTINGESTFTYDGSKLKVSPSGNGYTEIGIDAQIGTQNNPFLRFTHTLAAPSVGITLGRLEFSGSDNSTSTSDGIRAYVSAEYEGLLGGTALVFGVADNNASIAAEGMRLHQDSNLEVVGEVTAANFITTSDRRLKADITPIQEGLETIKKFVSYEYTKNGLKEAGFIAQEVQESLPYAVREGEDGFLRMTDRAILAHMHKAILELEQKIKEIENKL